MKKIAQSWTRISLIKRILMGLIVGVLFALTIPEYTSWVTIFGQLFIKALKAVAPILVLVLVMHAISSHKSGKKTNMKSILVLYLVATISAGISGVVASFLFPTTLTLKIGAEDVAPPSGILEVLSNVLFNTVSNPIDALLNANYIGILVWAVVLGFVLKNAADSTKTMISNFSDAILKIVRWVIEFAPFGIMGLVFDAISTTGISALAEYGRLLLVLLSCLLFVAFVVNPLIVFIYTRQNPYPLVWKSITGSAVTAFFTRSSAANIPVNLNLCKELGFDEDTYSVSIPLGANISMGGAAVTISILTLAGVHTLGIEVDFITACILVVLSALAATGASGVAGGSLLLIPLACSLFGISDDIAMQIIGVGFIIGVLQDSTETALNSSSDIVFTGAADIVRKKKNAANQVKNEQLGEMVETR